LQSYLAVIAVTKLTVASVVTERQRAVGELRAAHDELDRRVHKRTAMLSSVNDALRVEIAERGRAENRFRRLLESAPDAMIIAGTDGRIQLVNSQAEKMFRYQRNELIGQPIDRLVPQSKRVAHATHRDNFVASAQARPMGAGLELHGLRGDGREFPVEIALSPIEVEEGLVICAAIRDTTEKKELEARLMSAERRKADDMRELAAAVQGAQEEERRRVALELHDDLGQRLAAFKLNVHFLEQGLTGATADDAQRMNKLKDDLDDMIGAVRELSHNLRPLALDDFGLTVALEMLCKEFEKGNTIETHLDVSASVRSIKHPQLDIALYRIAQGALTNVARHAAASKVSIQLSDRDHHVVLSVEDDGRGFDLTELRARRDVRSGMGLRGMRERAELLGGAFEVESTPQQGTKIQVRIPVPQAGD
jgi:PAS domain S-box-containing protein